MNQIKFRLAILLIAGITFNSTNAQEGYSSASFAWGKMNAKQKKTAISNGTDYFAYGVPKPEDVILEEYFNYHHHNINMPIEEESVAIDLQWGNKFVTSSNKNAILQIGIATSELNKGSLADAPPVNVSLVIDKSGSMGSDNRIENAKQAAVEFVLRLRPTDYISIIAFDNYVEIMLPSTQVGNKEDVLTAIDKIKLGGSTNLNAGLIAGYGEVAKAYTPGQANKVIFLTDALTNTGTVDPQSIVRNSEVFNKGYNIDISMIGVGVTFNADLARQITNSAKSSIHFINDSEDIQKVFIDEVESLLCPVTREAQLVIEFDDGIELTEFFGYNPIIQRNQIRLRLNNMNKGMTQIFLMQFKVKDPEATIPPVQATIEFFDISKNQGSTIQGSAQLKNKKSGTEFNLLTNREVKKNYAIASIAKSIHDMADYVQKAEYTAAKETVDYTLRIVDELFDGVYDEDVTRVLDILKAYQTDMAMAINANNK